MRGSNKRPKKSVKIKQRANDWAKNTIVLVVFGGALILFAYMSMQVDSKEGIANDNYLASLPAQQDTIAHDKICMVDNIYQANSPTILLTVSNRSYYSCSAKATQELATKPNIRQAVDPITKNQIDKATAVIALHPKRDGTVLYFESEKTFNQYLNQQRTQ